MNNLTFAYKWRIEQNVYSYITGVSGYIDKTASVTSEKEDEIVSTVSKWTESEYTNAFNSMVSAVKSEYNVYFNYVDYYWNLQDSNCVIDDDFCVNLVLGIQGAQGRVDKTRTDNEVKISVPDVVEGNGTYRKFQFVDFEFPNIQGNQGAQGLQGVQGAQGVAGSQGGKGIDGSHGYSYTSYRIYLTSTEDISNLTLTDTQKTKFFDIDGKLTDEKNWDTTPITGWTKNNQIKAPIWTMTLDWMGIKGDTTITPQINVSAPYKITGEDAASDSENDEFIYIRTKDTTIIPMAPKLAAGYQGSYKSIGFQALKEDGTEFTTDEAYFNNNGTAWTDSPKGITNKYKCEWQAHRHGTTHKVAENQGYPTAAGYAIDWITEGNEGKAGYNKFGYPEYETPTIWSRWGENGADGDGVDYVFFLATDDISIYLDQINLNIKDEDEFPELYFESTSGQTITDNIDGSTITIKGNGNYWSDDPMNVDEEYDYQYVSISKEKDENGKCIYTTPVFWNRYVSDGEPGTPAQIVGTFDTYNYYGKDNVSDISFSLYNQKKDTDLWSWYCYNYQNEDTTVQPTLTLTIGDMFNVEGTMWTFMEHGTSFSTVFQNAGSLKGDKGDQTYIHVKFATRLYDKNSKEEVDTQAYIDANGWDGWTDNSGESDTNAVYMGVYTDYTEADSPYPWLYTFSRFTGKDGNGYEFIYKGSTSYTKPNQPSLDYISEYDTFTCKDINGKQISKDGSTDISSAEYWEELYGKSYDFIPKGWSDNATDITLSSQDSKNGFKYRWRTVRRYDSNESTWLPFENVTLDYAEGPQGSTGAQGAQGSAGTTMTADLTNEMDSLTVDSTYIYTCNPNLIFETTAYLYTGATQTKITSITIGTTTVYNGSNMNNVETTLSGVTFYISSEKQTDYGIKLSIIITTNINFNSTLITNKTLKLVFSVKGSIGTAYVTYTLKALYFGESGTSYYIVPSINSIKKYYDSNNKLNVYSANKKITFTAYQRKNSNGGFVTSQVDFSGGNLGYLAVSIDGETFQNAYYYDSVEKKYTKPNTFYTEGIDNQIICEWWDTKNSISHNIVDKETVPVVIDGKNGNDSISINLDNDTDMVSINDKNETLRETVLTTTVTMYKGLEIQPLKTCSCTTCTSTGTRCQYGDADNYITAKTSGFTSGNTKCTISITIPSGITLDDSNKAYVRIAVASSAVTETQTIMFSIVGLNIASRLYLNPSIKTINYDPNEDKYGITSWSCNLMEQPGEGNPSISTRACTFKYKYDDNDYITKEISKGNNATISDSTGIATYKPESELVIEAYINDVMIDKETIPIVKSGINGSNPLQVNLSNDTDMIGLDDDFKVIADTVFTTVITMYEGSTPMIINDISEDVSPSDIGITVVDEQEDEYTFISEITVPQGTQLNNDGKITITYTLTSADDDSKQQQAVFSILGLSGIGSSRYALTPSISTIIGDPNVYSGNTLSLTPTSFSVDLIQYDGNSNPYVSKTPCKLLVYVDGSTTVDKTIDLSDSGVTDTATIGIVEDKLDDYEFEPMLASIEEEIGGSEISGSDISGSEISQQITYITTPSTSVTIEAKISLDGTNYVTVDKETIPIVKDGINGTGSIVVDLDNENDMISLNANDNKTLTETTLTTNVTALYGTEGLDITSINATSTVSSIRLESKYINSSDHTKGRKCTITVPSGILFPTDGKAYVDINCTFSGSSITGTQSKSVRFSIIGLAGVNRLYLELSDNNIKRNRDSGSGEYYYATSSITATMKEVVNNTIKDTTIDGYFKVLSDGKVVYDGLTYFDSVEIESNHTWAIEKYSPSDKFRIEWYRDDGLFIDGETLPVVEDGVIGDISQTNLFGYNTVIYLSPKTISGSKKNAVHTDSGFAFFDTLCGTDQYYQVFLRKDNKNNQWDAGTYSLSGKITSSQNVTMQLGCDNLKESISGNNYYNISANTPTFFEWKFTTSGSTSVDSSDAGYLKDAPYWLFFGDATITLINISNLKFEDASNINGVSTPFDGLASDNIPQNPNIIIDSQFKDSTKWISLNGVKTDYLYQGVSGINHYGKVSAKSMEVIAEQSLTDKLKASTWYTLSYYALINSIDDVDNFNIISYIYSDVGDASVVCLQDDVAMQGRTDNSHTINEDHNLGVWDKHTITFKTPSTFSSGKDIRVLWRVDNTTSSDHSFNISLCMPKLEECEKATSWCTNEVDKKGENGVGSDGKIMRGPSVWAKGTTYQGRDDTNGKYIDLVVTAVTADTIYMCIKGHAASPSNEPSAGTDKDTYWIKSEIQDFIATKYLTAVNATIETLTVKKLITDHTSGVTYETTNEDSEIIRYHEDISDTDGYSNGHIQIYNNIFELYGKHSFPSIRLKTDANGNGFLIFSKITDDTSDYIIKDGKTLYKCNVLDSWSLGYNGLVDLTANSDYYYKYTESDGQYISSVLTGRKFNNKDSYQDFYQDNSGHTLLYKKLMTLEITFNKGYSGFERVSASSQSWSDTKDRYVVFYEKMKYVNSKLVPLIDGTNSNDAYIDVFLSYTAGEEEVYYGEYKPLSKISGDNYYVKDIDTYNSGDSYVLYGYFHGNSSSSDSSFAQMVAYNYSGYFDEDKGLYCTLGSDSHTNHLLYRYYGTLSGVTEEFKDGYNQNMTQYHFYLQSSGTTNFLYSSLYPFDACLIFKYSYTSFNLNIDDAIKENMINENYVSDDTSVNFNPDKGSDGQLEITVNGSTSQYNLSTNDVIAILMIRGVIKGYFYFPCELFYCDLGTSGNDKSVEIYNKYDFAYRNDNEVYSKVYAQSGSNPTYLTPEQILNMIKYGVYAKNGVSANQITVCSSHLHNTYLNFYNSNLYGNIDMNSEY